MYLQDNNTLLFTYVDSRQISIILFRHKSKLKLKFALEFDWVTCLIKDMPFFPLANLMLCSFSMKMFNEIWMANIFWGSFKVRSSVFAVYLWSYVTYWWLNQYIHLLSGYDSNPGPLEQEYFAITTWPRCYPRKICWMSMLHLRFIIYFIGQPWMDCKKTRVSAIQ